MAKVIIYYYEILSDNGGDTEMLRIALCDDNKRYTDALKNVITEYSDKKGIDIEIKAFSDGKEIVEAREKFDIIFLDIEMEDMNGMDTAKHIRQHDMNVPIVYVTSYSDYWRSAYQVHAFQFIVKPFKRSEIYGVLDDYFKLIHDAKEEQIRLISDDGMLSVRVNDIYYFYIKKKKEIMLQTVAGEYIVKENLSDIYDKLGKGQFYAPHRCCIINLRYVDRIENNYDIIMENGDFLPLAQKKKDEFLDRLSEQFVSEFRGAKV